MIVVERRLVVWRNVMERCIMNTTRMVASSIPTRLGNSSSWGSTKEERLMSDGAVRFLRGPRELPIFENQGGSA